MISNQLMQIALFYIVLILLAIPLGSYIACVYEGKKTWITFIFKPVENFIYKLLNVKPEDEMSWRRYTIAILGFSFVSMLFVFAVLKLQNVLPLNPQKFGSVPTDLAFNTAVSYTTNTNFQSYAGEKTMSYLSQTIGLTFQNFVSAAVGGAVAIALIRGLTRKDSKTIGNFWVDLVRFTLYVLIPLSLVFSIFLVSQGVIQNFLPYTRAKTLEGVNQVIAQGPVASQEAIKMLGVNGGGFFGANSAHPFENPTPLTNFFEMIAILLIPASFVFAFGKLVKDKRQGWTLIAVMSIMFFLGLALVLYSEQSGNTLINSFGIDVQATNIQAGGNMEGKEVRFGITNSAMFSTVTTDASCGAVNNMHDSLTPLAGFVTMLNMKLGEIIFGGVGSGLYGMIIFVILTVFVAGLMVGRIPEYLGKKIEISEIKMAMLASLVIPICVLTLTAIACVFNNHTFNNGAHGFSEILYAFTSASANNGSAFAGLNTNTAFYNYTLAIAMLIGRYVPIALVLAIAGSMANKKILPPTTGTFPTHGGTFALILIAVILIVGALTFFPALALGPLLEHLQMAALKVF